MRTAFVLVFTSAFMPWLAAQQPGEMQKAVNEFKLQSRNLGLRPDSPPSASAKRRFGLHWHGRLFENFRNDILDAVPHEIRQSGADKSLLRRKSYGLTYRVRYVIPKLYDGSHTTFFSVSYEAVRERISRSSLRTVPTTGQRTGDYSNVVDHAGNLLAVYDPATTRLNPGFDPTQPVSQRISSICAIRSQATTFPRRVSIRRRSSF